MSTICSVHISIMVRKLLALFGANLLGLPVGILAELQGQLWISCPRNVRWQDPGEALVGELRAARMMALPCAWPRHDRDCGSRLNDRGHRMLPQSPPAEEPVTRASDTWRPV